MKYFIADLHFGGIKEYTYTGRPFPSYKHFEDAVMNNICKRVGSSDTLVIVGDLLNYDKSVPNGDAWEAAAERIREMPGTKIAVMGNNEDRLVQYVFKTQEALESFYISKGISKLVPQADTLMCGQPVHVVHDPTACRTDRLNIFGHIHHEASIGMYGVNVSCDLTGYMPLSEDEFYIRVDRFASWTIDGDEMGEMLNVFPKDLWKKYKAGWADAIKQAYLNKMRTAAS